VSDQEQRRVPRSAKIAAVVAVLTMLVVAHRLGILQQFTEPARVKQTLLELGGWGYAAFIAAYAFLHPFGIPGMVFVVAAPLIWPWPVAFVLSMIGTMAGTIVGFSFSRFVARDWVSSIIPERFRKYDEALARRGFLTVFVLRVIFWMPPLLHASFGISKVRFQAHFWGSFLGYLLPIFLVSYFGERLFQLMKTLSTGAWIGIGLVIVSFWLTLWMIRRRVTRASAE
jgi:uncharacterized membrane protein YdjX (TVP38/TMEM64 family)